MSENRVLFLTLLTVLGILGCIGLVWVIFSVSTALDSTYKIPAPLVSDNQSGIDQKTSILEDANSQGTQSMVLTQAVNNLNIQGNGYQMIANLSKAKRTQLKHVYDQMMYVYLKNNQYSNDLIDYAMHHLKYPFKIS